MAKKQSDTFEDLYLRLEETVSKLEAGNLPLEESIALYEEGLALAQRCQELLDGAELRISKLKESFLNTSYSATEAFDEPNPVFDDELDS